MSLFRWIICHWLEYHPVPGYLMDEYCPHCGTKVHNGVSLDFL